MDVVASTPEGGARLLREIKAKHFAGQDMWVIDSTAGVNEPKLKRYITPSDTDIPTKERLQ